MIIWASIAHSCLPSFLIKGVNSSRILRSVISCMRACASLDLFKKSMDNLKSPSDGLPKSFISTMRSCQVCLKICSLHTKYCSR